MGGLKYWAGVGMAVSVMGAAAVAGVATAQDVPPPGLTWYVLNQMNSFGFDIEDPTNRPELVNEVPAGVLVPVDINEDGRTDWLINWPNESQFCGTGGCRRSLYVSTDDGFVRVFDRQADDIDIRKVNGETRIESSFHHLYCDDKAEDCRLAWGWDRRAGRLEERPGRDGEHILTSLTGPPIDQEGEAGQPQLPNWTPDRLVTLYQDGARVCPVADVGDVATTLYPVLRSIPDLNGDGVRDWVIDAPISCGPEEVSDYGYQVWVSSGTDAWTGTETGEQGRDVVLAWQGEVDHRPHLDIGQNPARLIDAGPCATDTPCQTRLLTWNPASRRLIP